MRRGDWGDRRQTVGAFGDRDAYGKQYPPRRDGHDRRGVDVWRVAAERWEASATWWRLAAARARRMAAVAMTTTVVALLLVWVVLLTSCTEITTYYPVCVTYTVDARTGVVTAADTLPVPDSACAAAFASR